MGMLVGPHRCRKYSHIPALIDPLVPLLNTPCLFNE